MKSVFITGGSSGIGRAIAAAFHDAGGYHVLTCGRAATQGPQFLGSRHRHFAVDVSSTHEVADVCEHISQAYGPIDVLVNNAGQFIPDSILSADYEALDRLMDVNLMGAYRFVRGFVPGMVSAGRGTVVNICSTASIKAFPAGGLYCITKHAMLGFGRALREELREKNIRVISMMPGPTLTRSWDGVDLPESRFMSAVDIAKLTLSVCEVSDSCVVEEMLIRPMLGDI